MFIVTLTYVKPLDEVDRFIDAHMAWLEEQYARGLFLFSGPRVPRTGGIIVAAGGDREALDAALARDPFQAVASYEVVEMRATTVAEGLVFPVRG